MDSGGDRLGEHPARVPTRDVTLDKPLTFSEPWSLHLYPSLVKLDGENSYKVLSKMLALSKFSYKSSCEGMGVAEDPSCERFRQSGRMEWAVQTRLQGALAGCGQRAVTLVRTSRVTPKTWPGARGKHSGRSLGCRS